MSSRIAIVTVASTVACAGACGGAQPAAPQRCSEGERVQVDCSSEISYQGITTAGGISALSVFQGSGKYEDVAIRRVNDNVARYISAQTRLCRDYNACVVDAATYRAEASKTRDLLLNAAELATKLTSAKSDPEHARAFDELYTRVVPEQQRVEELTFQMAIEAQLPASAGGGMLNLAPLQPLPTNTRIAFTFKASTDAYLYIFQVSASRAVTVLFPDKRIGTSNPMRGGELVRVPSQGQSFRVNEEDLGRENIYIVASRKSVPSLDAAVVRVTSGQVSQVGQDSLLANLATVKPAADSDCQGTKTRSLELEGSAAPATSGCTRTRGLVLEASDGSKGNAQPSIRARTSPGDNTIIKVFPFEHVSESAYGTAQQDFQSPQKIRQRGILLEE